MSALEPLLTLQEHDLALDRLRHRRATLPERDALAQVEAGLVTSQGRVAELRVPRDALAREQQRHEDEAQTVAERATAVDKRMYSGEISSPRELQAMGADVEMLRKQQRASEEKALEAMEAFEPLDAEITEYERAIAVLEQEAGAARAALTAAEAAVDDEIAAETAARAAAAQHVGDAGLVADYERRRVQSNGQGAARLVGHTCQACHLTVPATEIDRIRRAPAGTIAYCDNCGAILVP